MVCSMMRGPVNPIRARVTLGLRVLSYDDLLPTNPGYWLYLANQIGKEALAVIGGVRSTMDVFGAE